MPLDFQIDAENSPVDAKEEARQAAKAIVEEILNKVCAPFAEEVLMSENANRKQASEPHVQDGVQLKLTHYTGERSGEEFCTPSASPNSEALRHPSEESDATVGEDNQVYYKSPGTQEVRLQEVPPVCDQRVVPGERLSGTETQRTDFESANSEATDESIKTGQDQ